MMMSVNERIRYLLRVAARAEGMGDARIARIFRRMAEEARPLDGVRFVPVLHPELGCCNE